MAVPCIFITCINGCLTGIGSLLACRSYNVACQLFPKAFRRAREISKIRCTEQLTTLQLAVVGTGYKNQRPISTSPSDAGDVRRISNPQKSNLLSWDCTCLLNRLWCKVQDCVQILVDQFFIKLDLPVLRKQKNNKYEYIILTHINYFLLTACHQQTNKYLNLQTERELRSCILVFQIVFSSCIILCASGMKQVEGFQIIVNYEISYLFTALLNFCMIFSHCCLYRSSVVVDQKRRLLLW